MIADAIDFSFKPALPQEKIITLAILGALIVIAIYYFVFRK